ncbi:MAG TPA: mercury methylation corrinoid protein HgcA [Thermodesulfobacteriota bacterium]|nr:mercury methylation corrinoid protein HgcA [Thermodesulfobacteriota bacterium]
MSLPRLDQPFVVGSVETKAGAVPQISSALVWADRLGTFKVRWGIGRMNYKVDPGLYTLGRPDDQSPVLVTANYKMSFDNLRKALPGRDAWILVLDTRGINVWCAAGKGTFGTMELVTRLESSGLAHIVSHRELILPQLSGPGISAHLVKKLSGFRVIYGPIRAVDVPAFLNAGMKATPSMRFKTFTTWERAVLIPVELVGVLKAALIILPIFFFIDSFWRAGGFWANALAHGIFSVLAILSGILAGAVLTPLLLPWLPGRSFSLKGLIPGVLVAVIAVAFRWSSWEVWQGRLELAAWLFLIPAISAYLAMMFTGSSTYTSLSGVRKEMRRAVPLQIGAGILGLGLWVGSHLMS